MSINIHILKASGRLEKFEDQIRYSCEEAIKDVENLIKIPSLDIVIDDDKTFAIPETGVGGHAPTAHVLYVHIDPDFKDSETHLDFEIKSTLAHEFHHCARWAACGYGETLLEVLVSEGLADHFDIEINGNERKPWTTAIRGEELEKIKARAELEFDSRDYDHNAWFFGMGKENILRWAGYSLGFLMVGEYMKKTGKKASELVGENAKFFILKKTESKKKIINLKS